MKDKYFFDTNVLIYSFDSKNTVKQQKAGQLIKSALVESKGCISYQVIQEFLIVATEKFTTPLTLVDYPRCPDSVLQPLCQVCAGIDLNRVALELMLEWQYSFYGSIIIGAVLYVDCKILYSKDLYHRQTINSLTIVNPFLSSVNDKAHPTIQSFFQFRNKPV